MSNTHAVPPKDRAAEGILWLIQSRGLCAGDRLPPERVLCERLGVSRTALRGAIAQLVSTHTLESRQGTGTYVCATKPMNIFQRSSSFSDMVRKAGMNPSAQVLCNAVYAADGWLAEKLAVPAGTSVFELRRVRLADGTPLAIETTYVNRTNCAGVENHDYATESLFKVLASDYGIEARHGHERISITRVSLEEAEVLCVPAGTPAYFETAHQRTEDGVPVEYCTGVILPDRFCFASVESGSTEVNEAWLRV